jgi:hypothetical protein
MNNRRDTKKPDESQVRGEREKVKEVWGQLLGLELPDADVNEIVKNVGGLFDILTRWRDEIAGKTT